MAKSCNNVCKREDNVRGTGHWKANGYRLCSICEVAYEVPPGTESYPCPCCHERTRGNIKGRN